MFRIKMILAFLLDISQINRLKFLLLHKKTGKNYIRIVNYHRVLKKDAACFEKQLRWYQKHFSDVNEPAFKQFLDDGTLPSNKPGLMLTFDDGFRDNYEVAFPLMKQYGFTGYYMVSSDLVGAPAYMTQDMLKALLEAHHVIGCHTATHHRFNPDDSDEVLIKEIVSSKADLEKMLNASIDIFCWCGGEEQHYTKSAAKVIFEAAYGYSLLTNSYPVYPDNHRFLLERTNVESSWPLCLVRFQLCGFMDDKYTNKRQRVEKLILDGMNENGN